MRRPIVRVGIGNRIVQINVQTTNMETVIPVTAHNRRGRNVYPYSFVFIHLGGHTPYGAFPPSYAFASLNRNSLLSSKWFTRERRPKGRVGKGNRIAQSNAQTTNKETVIPVTAHKRIVNLSVVEPRSVTVVGTV